MFIPRLTAPDWNSKYWIVTSRGGYNRCIPIYGGPSVTPNCFTGDTEIITRNGTVRLDSIVDESIEALSEGGIYRPAKGIYCGKQHIYRVTFANGKSYDCTANHRWVVHKISYYNGKRYIKDTIKTTLELKSCDHIPYVFINDEDKSFEGIQNGFIYGDGRYYCGRRYSCALLCGAKIDYMRDYFKDAPHSCTEAHGVVNYYSYPNTYKQIPPISSDLSYLRGFICGLLASDGCVDKYGCPSISTVKKEDAIKISEILSVLGYIHNVIETVRDTNYKSDSHLFRLDIKKESIPPSMFLNPTHYARICEKRGNRKYTSIKSIVDLGIETDVYCIQEPETHTMVLKGGILTGQCTGYVHGRYMEIMGATSCNLSIGNAGEYWGFVQDGYERGSTPKLGAVICWRRPGEAGHVAIVEQINPDGSIVTSNSAYHSTRFYTQTLYPPNYTWSSNYILQGFIYNPAVSGGLGNMVEGFLTAAKNLVGKKLSRGFKNSLGPSIQLVTRSAMAVPGLINVIIPTVGAPSDLAKKGVVSGMGDFIEGPAYGNMKAPQVGDIVLLRNDESRTYQARNDCDKLAIVTEVKNSDISAVHVNSSNVVANTTYKISYKAICGYYRPKWEKVNNIAFAAGAYTQVGSLYDTTNTAEDATIREIGYLSTDYKPTVASSNIRLSVVNYTTLLSTLFNTLVGTCNTGMGVITDGLPQKAKIIVDFLLGKGLNAAAACGIIGNIKSESEFNTASIGDYGTSFGICQWHFERGDRMKQVAGSDWKNNLTGQLEYLWQELQSTYYATVLAPLNAVANTQDGAMQAADIFVRHFEIPDNINKESEKRQAQAAEYYNLLVFQADTSAMGSSFVMNGTAFSGKTIEVPQWVPQDHLAPIYTNYSYFYSRWGGSTYQRKVADLWAKKGKKSNRGIATIDGLYLIALKPIFGNSGDKVSVILRDGTVINCLIGDIQAAEDGYEGGSIYGHAYGGRHNIVEWETVGSTTSYRTDNPDLSGWSGKDVARIINGGSIL